MTKGKKTINLGQSRQGLNGYNWFHPTLNYDLYNFVQGQPCMCVLLFRSTHLSSWCVWQASASCQEARARRRPLSTSVPSTRCPCIAPGNWPSPTAAPSRPRPSLPGKVCLQTSRPHRRPSAAVPRWGHMNRMEMTHEPLTLLTVNVNRTVV